MATPGPTAVSTTGAPPMRRVLASFLWLGSASLVGQVVSWVSTVLVIRLLSPDDYGLMAMAMLAISFLMLIGDLGVGAVVVQACRRPRSTASICGRSSGPAC
jgi:O-antigen/teichoic acid export membrane protein